MIDNKWFCEPDDGRESWCFLDVKMNGQKNNFVITGWEIGYGNPTKMTRLIASEGKSEREIIERLLCEIHYCRKKEVVLITFGADVLPAFRTRIISLSIKEAYLRELKHICVQDLIEEFFLMGNDKQPVSSLSKLADTITIKIKGQSQVELLRDLLLKVGPIIPSEVI